MIKTELEQLLETGFSALGTEFGEREYVEDIRLGAEVDDVLFGRPQIKGNFDNLKDYITNITDYQFDIELFDDLFFRRIAKNCNGFKVEYRLESTEKMIKYRSEADRLVREGKIRYETVFIGSIEPSRGAIGIYKGGVKGKSEDNVTIDDMDELTELNGYLLFQNKNPIQRLRPIIHLHNKKFNPKDISKAVFNLLKH